MATRTLIGLPWIFTLAAVCTFATRSPAAGEPPKADDFVVVEVDGEGMSEDEALKMALRAALERGGKQEIFSNSHVENFQLMHDTIITRAVGLVTDYQVISKG